MKKGLWLVDGFPKKGWTELGVDDRRTPDEKCQVCGYEEVRFVHFVRHPDWPKEMEVGCVCAGDLTGNSALARELHTKAVNLADRRITWKKKTFRLTKKGDGSVWLAQDGWLFLLAPNADKTWRASLKGPSGVWENPPGRFSSPEEAKLAVFDWKWPSRIDAPKPPAPPPTPWKMSKYREDQVNALLSGL